MAHTPGPWNNIVGNGAGDFWHVHQKDEGIDGGYFCRIDAMNRNEEARAIARANARLITAAPDLLRELQACAEYIAMQWGDDPENAPVLLANANAAIAKATGK